MITRALMVGVAAAALLASAEAVSAQEALKLGLVQSMTGFGNAVGYAIVNPAQAGAFAKQFVERGMDKSGIRIVGPGDLTDDDDLPSMTDAILGIVSAHHYSAVHDSPINKSFVASFKNA